MMGKSVEEESKFLENVHNFMETVVRQIGLEVEIKVEKKEKYIGVDISGENLGLLIGRRGETLMALQYLANIAANKGRLEERRRIIVDVEGYRERRRKSLEELAERMAEKVVTTGEAVALQPMNAFERRIIHMALRENQQVETISEGEEPNRRVTIKSK